MSELREVCSMTWPMVIVRAAAIGSSVSGDEAPEEDYIPQRRHGSGSDPLYRGRDRSLSHDSLVLCPDRADL
jgi:hypothetical protein